MNEIYKIINRINQFANAFDTKDWDKLENCLAETIKYNYSDLRKSSGQCSRDEYVSKREQSLTTLMTQHLFSNIEVINVEQTHAQLQASAMIYRKADSDICFNTHAIYLFGLDKIEDSWLISEITQTVIWNDGDKSIHSGAM